MNPKFSICIPNYNYENYIDLTLDSVNQQTFEDFEVNISDNASSDSSLDVIKKHAAIDDRICYKANPTNIGFAGNLDVAGRMANGDWMIMLSSDDIINDNALSEYNKFIQIIPISQKFAFCSTFEKIDSEGNFIEFMSAKTSSVWKQTDIDELLSSKMGFPLYKVKTEEMLKRCFTRFINPFNFASTCYSKNVYESVGGYGGGRLYNPDKWFHWKIISEIDYVYFLDAPLFQYRWHDNNQANQQNQNQILKFWMDEYRNCFEITPKMIEKSGLNEKKIQQNFIDRCIAPYIYYHIKNGNGELAKRILNFGLSCYPTELKKNKYFIVLKISLINYITCKIALLITKFIKPKL